MKALVLKEVTAKSSARKAATAKSSAHKAATRKRATLGKKNLPSVTAAPASVVSVSSFTSATTSVSRTGMPPLNHHCHLLLTRLAGNTVPMPATAEAGQGLTPAVSDTIIPTRKPTPEEHADILILRGERFDFFLHICY